MLLSPKPTLITLILLFLFSNVNAQNAWINEFHYDNVGGDEGEFVEIVIENASSIDLSLLSLHRYNGSDGESDGSYSLDSFVEGDTHNNFKIYYLQIPGIQNGAPDGFALDYNGSLIQFISYEGDFMGVGGPADGEISNDVSVEEDGSTLIGESLQLRGNGKTYLDFTWYSPSSESPGQLNDGQTLGAACAGPTSQAIFSLISEEDIKKDQVTLKWARGDGDAVLVLGKKSNPVDVIPQNGINYSSSAEFGSGLSDEVGEGNFVVYNGNDTTADVIGLTQGTDYHFAIFEYLTTDVCYLTDSETTSLTTSTQFDDNSKIQAANAQIESAHISSMVNEESAAVDVFNFDIQDQGSTDSISTFLHKAVIEKSLDNTVSDWSQVIKGALLTNTSGDIISSLVSISTDQILIDFEGNAFEVADGTTETLTLSIWLQESLNDGDILGFQIPENHDFEVLSSGSFLSKPSSVAINSNSFTIEVEATDFRVATVRSAQVNEAFNLNLTAIDANGNTDSSSRNIILSLNTGNGNLSSLSVGLGLVAMNKGFFEWTDLKYDREEDIIIQISDDNGLIVNTPRIDILPLITSVFFSEYVEGSGGNKAIEIYNDSGSSVDLVDFSIARYTNGSETSTAQYELSEIQSNLADQASLVIAYSSAEDEILEVADEINSITFFNGDDALALLYKGSIIDVIGQIGVQPANGWNVAGISQATQDRTLVRKASISEGNPNYLASLGSNAFDSEWVVYEQDEFSFLGFHFTCDAPDEQAIDLDIQEITENSAKITWTTSAHLQSLVLIKEEEQPDVEPVSGTSYSANEDFLVANEIGSGNKIVFAGDADSVNISNLRDGTNYHIAIYSSLDSCYNLVAPLVGSFTTLTALDDDSEINALSQTYDSHLPSTVDSESEAQEIFSFQISDLATRDTVATVIEKIILEATEINSLDWENTLNAILKDENGKVDSAQFTINRGRIEIEFPQDSEYEIPSGTSMNFTLAVWFNRFEISDTSLFALQIPADHGFVTANSGSSFLNRLSEDIFSTQIEVAEAFDPIHEIRNGENGMKYSTVGYISSNDFGVNRSAFYIQNDESTTFEKGIAVSSDLQYSNGEVGNKVNVQGIREDVNGVIRIKADTLIFLDSVQFTPETYTISGSQFNSINELIGTRVQLDSLILLDTDLWIDSVSSIFRFLKGSDTLLINIKPNNIYFEGNAQVPFATVDVAGVMENSNDSLQLLITQNGEISDSYPPSFIVGPTLNNIQPESVILYLTVNELSTVYYAIQNAIDSIPDLQTLKDPQNDELILNSGNRNIQITNVNDTISLNFHGLASNTEYSIFAVLEDTLGNESGIYQVDFRTPIVDADDDVKVLASTSQLPETVLNAYETSRNFTPVFNFIVEDGGTNDDRSTFITQMVIHSTIETEVDLDEILHDVQLYDFSNGEVVDTQHSIFPDSLVLELNEIFELSDADSSEFQLRIKLSDEAEDEKNIGFMIPPSNSGWVLESSGSQLAADFGEQVVSSSYLIDVVATELIINYPSEVYVNESFNISLSVQDQNANIDLTPRVFSFVPLSEDTSMNEIELLLSNGEGVFEHLRFSEAGQHSFEITDGAISEIFELNFIKPELIVDTSGDSLDFGLITYPERSEPQSYLMSTENLRDSILIVVSHGFQLSITSDFISENDTLVLDQTDLIHTEIFVRFSPTVDDGAFYSGHITHFSQDADTMRLEVSGQEGTVTLSRISEIRDRPFGERVKINGVVVGGENHFTNKRIIQDQSAGIAIEGLNSANLKYGDSVQVQGVLEQIDNWPTVIPEKEIVVLASDSTVVHPLQLIISELADSLEFQRVKIKNLSILEQGLFRDTTYRVYDENDTIIFILGSENHPLIGKEIPFEKMNIVGFITKVEDYYHIFPEFQKDLEIIARDTILKVEVPLEGLNFGKVFLDEYSGPKSYSLQGQNLVEDLKVSVNKDFQISLLKESNYAHELILPINARGNIPEINIYVRFSPVSGRAGKIEGGIIHFSGSKKDTVDLNGIADVVTPNVLSMNEELLIFPNPVDSELIVEMKGQNKYNYKVVNLEGGVLVHGTFVGGHVLDLNHLLEGIYYLRIVNEKESYAYKFIKK